MRDKGLLLTQLRHTAYRHYAKTGKKYKLTSGQLSDEYLDVKNSILDPDVSFNLTCAVTSIIGSGRCNIVAGVELGGALLALLVAKMRIRPCLVVRKDERTHGNTVRGLEGIENIEGAEFSFSDNDKLDVWLIEDVITTGESALKAVNRLETFDRFRVIGVVAVVDREQGGIQAIKEKHPKLFVQALTTLSEIRATA